LIVSSDGSYFSVVCSSDGSVLAYTDAAGRVHRRELRTGTETMAKLESNSNMIALSPDGHTLCYVIQSGGDDQLRMLALP
jgi:hypothetical protein